MYDKTYFEAEEFKKNNYKYMAEVIMSIYNPKKIIEFGCGAGYLTQELVKYGVEMVSLDGFFKPNIENGKFKYFKHDFNDTQGLQKIVKELGSFDLAICMEVAEHLNPEVSKDFISVLTSSSDKIIFSSAVLYQSGTAHINCRDRVFWDALFNEVGYYFKDEIRSEFRKNETVEIWYKLNSMFYSKTQLSNIENTLQLKKLLASESYASSEYFKLYSEFELQVYKLNLFPIKQFLKFRNFVKTILGKPKLE